MGAAQGTNGGVTQLGLAASTAGGLFVGLMFYGAALASPTLLAMPGQAAAAARQWQLVPLGALCGGVLQLFPVVLLPARRPLLLYAYIVAGAPAHCMLLL